MPRSLLKPLDEYRQSTLAGMETCPRRTRFAIERPEITTGYMEHSADLGTVFHDVARRILRTLWQQDEQQAPTQEAIEIMYEAMAESPITLPADEREELRWLVLGFCDFKWPAKRIMALEERLTAEIVCRDGEVRTFKGQPDVLIADPPSGIVVVDYKSGRGVPKAPRVKPPEGETVTGKQYLSERGHFQLDGYGLLALRRWPFEYATLREVHLRSGEVREATLTRDDLEHVERELGDLMMRVDRGITEGPKSEVWAPRPGKHCLRQCPVARSCPIPREMRGVGSITSEHQADDLADAYVRWKALYQQAHETVKAYHEETGYAPKVGDHVMRWDPPVGKGRKFGLAEPWDQSVDPNPEDPSLVAAIMAEAERVGER